MNVNGANYGDWTASSAIEKAKQSGNINIHNVVHTEIMDLSLSSREEQDKHAEMLRKLEAQRRARTMAVPTLPEEVANMLRKLGQPIKLFAESPADVRERLREHFAQLEMDGEGEIIQSLKEDEAMKQAAVSAPEGAKDEVVYTIASDALINARRVMAAYSFIATPRRLSNAKRRRNDSSVALSEDKFAANIYSRIKKLAMNVSAVGDERPISAVRVSPDGSIVASGSWSGIAKFWDINGLKNLGSVSGHNDRMTGLAWHPTAFLESGPSLLATASADKTACIWDVRHLLDKNNMDIEEKSRQHKPISTLTGHADRLARIEFHPCGKYVGTACYDHTWRLWDVETGAQILLQDGHSKEVYSISFQADGSLVATGDFGGVVRLWDLRSGKTVHSMTGHVKRVTCCDFSPNCYELGTGSDDHTIRIWDLRRKGCAYTLPAHAALISDLRYSKSGEVIASSSFDCTARLWNTRDFSMICTLKGHEGRISACDLTPNESRLVTCALDRTVKIWAHEDEF